MGGRGGGLSLLQFLSEEQGFPLGRRRGGPPLRAQLGWGWTGSRERGGGEKERARGRAGRECERKALIVQGGLGVPAGNQTQCLQCLGLQGSLGLDGQGAAEWVHGEEDPPTLGWPVIPVIPGEPRQLGIEWGPKELWN